MANIPGNLPFNTPMTVLSSDDDVRAHLHEQQLNLLRRKCDPKFLQISSQPSGCQEFTLPGRFMDRGYFLMHYLYRGNLSSSFMHLGKAISGEVELVASDLLAA